MKRTTLAFLAIALFTLAAALPASTAEYPPGVMFSTMLNGVKLLPETGELSLDNIQATFLPKSAPIPNQFYYYSPDLGGGLHAILKNSAGNEVAKFDFYVELLKQPYYLLTAPKITGPNESILLPGGRVKMQPGDYTLDFFVEGKQFYRFPFKVSKLSAADPFSGGDYYFLDGDWEKWAYMFYGDADPEKGLQLKVWLRNKEAANRRDFKPKIKITDSSGKLICTSRSGTTLTLHPQWTRYEMDIVDPSEGATPGKYWKAKDLLAKDGVYTLTLTLSDKVWGTWKIKVSGGKFAVSGRALRGSADTLTFIEGGRDAFWFEKQ